MFPPPFSGNVWGQGALEFGIETHEENVRWLMSYRKLCVEVVHLKLIFFSFFFEFLIFDLSA